ncbi:nuclear transport factor 2 family protein [Vibrio mexicanus]|uniref:nuclear transport factor 2 family protein n=1 Tax=Vibrio mexicanus TaxID=1004326 RepID=UPI00063CECE9|nr:nuclear transport factor 2 family protein [Vibrio mexicanus]
MNTQSHTPTSYKNDIELLEAFSAAWNRHDIDALMTFMTDDCVFHTASGDSALGNTFEGYEAVREGFQIVWKTYPDVAWLDANHFVAGDRAVTESTFCATKPDGSKIEVRMIDMFTLSNGKIKVKNAFRKDRPAIIN